MPQFESGLPPPLQRLGLWGSLSAQERDLVAACFESVTFEFGEIVVAEGERPSDYVVIASGRARVLQTAPDGTELALNVLDAGSTFGESELIEGASRTSTIRASSSSLEVWRLDGSVFLALMRLHPNLREAFGEPVDAPQRDVRAPLVARPAPASGHSSWAVSDEQLLAQIAAEDLGEKLPPNPHTGPGRNFPVVRQIDSADCGVACVAMLCRYYGHDISVPSVRAAVGRGLDGTTLRGILRGGAELGIEFTVIKTASDRLAELDLPMLLHWGGNRWVVLYEVSDGTVLLGDPANGLQVVDDAELAKEWTGYVAVPSPTDRFAKAPRAPRTVAWLKPFVRPHRTALILAAFLAVVATVLQMALPVLTQVVIDDLLDDRGAGRVSILVVGMLAALLTAVAATIHQRRMLARIATDIDGRVLDYIAERILRLPLDYIKVRTTADIQRRLDDMRELRRALARDGAIAVTVAFQLVVALIVMAFYSWVIALLFVVVAPLYLVLMRYFSRSLRPDSEALEESFARYESRQLDAIRGIEAVKVAGAEESFRRKLTLEFDGLADKLYRRNVSMMVSDGVVSMASLATAALFLWVGAILAINDQLTLGGVVAVLILVLLAGVPLRNLYSLWDELQAAGGLLARLPDLDHRAPDPVPDRDQPEGSLGGNVRPPGVRLSGVGFHHADSPEHQILFDISLEVPAGSTVALVGRSGSGKSTLLRCLAGLLIPTEGRIEFDGSDIREQRLHMGFVPSDPFLIDATIAENIAYGETDPDPDSIREAATIADAAEFIERLPLGYQTRVGESGVRLSTGQQQRVAIARAVYGRPHILLLDEPTSALDIESERAVTGAFGGSRHGRTVFVTARHPNTIRDADLICVLEQGHLVESGSHDELMALDGLYRYLVSQQLAD